MSTYSTKSHSWIAIALSVGLMLSGPAAMAAAAAAPAQLPAPGFCPRMGPGMMYNWTPQQRQQRWQQMHSMRGYGRGMMMGRRMGPAVNVPPPSRP